MAAATITKTPKVSPTVASPAPTSGLTSGDKSLAKYLASLYGPPQTPQAIQTQAQQQVTDTINPQIANLMSEATGQLKTGGDALKSIYDEEASRLGGIGDTVRADNAAAVQTEQGAGDALRNYLATEGGKLSSSVQGAAGGAPAGSALANGAATAAGNVGSLASGAAGEAAARTYTGLSDLNSEGAASQGFADALPGLSKLQAGQQLGSLASQVEGNVKTQSDTLLAQIPGMTQDLYTKLTEDNQQAQQAKAQVLNSFYGSALDRNTQAALTEQTLGKDMSVAQLQAEASKYGTDTRAATAASSLVERQKHDAALEAASQASYGISYQKLVDAEKKAKAAAANGGLTANDSSRLTKEAATELQTMYHGTPARYETGPGGQRILVSGTGPDSPVTYQNAIQGLMLKYPALGPARIVKMVNTLYKPGEGGRPALSKKQQTLANQLFPSITDLLKPKG